MFSRTYLLQYEIYNHDHTEVVNFGWTVKRVGLFGSTFEAFIEMKQDAVKRAIEKGCECDLSGFMVKEFKRV